ncbi:MAG: HflK protein, partial [Cypionkella sp.]
MAGTGGPWGGSGGDDGGKGPDRGPERGSDRGPNRTPPRRPNEGAPMPEIDELLKRGQEQFRVLMGGRGGGNGAGGGGSDGGPMITKSGLLLGGLAAVAVWAFMSFYTV